MNIASKVKLFSFGLLFGIIIRLFDKLYFYDYSINIFNVFTKINKKY